MIRADIASRHYMSVPPWSFSQLRSRADISTISTFSTGKFVPTIFIDIHIHTYILYLYNILYLRFSLCLEENATRHPSFSRTFYLIVSIFHNYLFLVLKRKIANITRSSINILKIWSRLGADTTTTRRQYYYSSFTTSSVSYCGGCSCTFIYYLSHCIFSHHFWWSFITIRRNPVAEIRKIDERFRSVVCYAYRPWQYYNTYSVSNWLDAKIAEFS